MKPSRDWTKAVSWLWHHRAVPVGSRGYCPSHQHPKNLGGIFTLWNILGALGIISGIVNLHDCLKIFQLRYPYEGGRDKGLTPSQHPVNGPELWADVTPSSSQSTDGLLLEQTGRCHFRSCSLYLSLFQKTNKRPVEFSRWHGMRSLSCIFWPSTEKWFLKVRIRKWRAERVCI